MHVCMMYMSDTVADLLMRPEIQEWARLAPGSAILNLKVLEALECY